MRSFTTALLTLCLVTWAVPLWAAKGAGACRPLQRGKALYVEGYFDLARQRLLEGKRICSEADAAGEIELYLGLLQAADGKLDATRRAFQEALRGDPTLTLDPNREKPALISLLRRIKREMRGTLHISAATKVKVTLDGKPLTLPHTSEIGIGAHRVVAVSAEGERFEQQIIVFAHKRTDLRIPPLVPKLAAMTGSPRSRWPHWSFWTSAGASIAAAGVGVAFAVLARNDRRSGERLQRGGITDDELQRFDSLDRRVDRNALIANISFGVAGALALTSAVLYVVQWRRSARSEKRSPRRASLTSFRLAF